MFANKDYTDNRTRDFITINNIVGREELNRKPTI